MNTMKKMSVARGDYRITWDGGDYADVHAPGLGEIETINMVANYETGQTHPFTRESLRDAVDAEDRASWDATVAEMRAYPTAGAR